MEFESFSKRLSKAMKYRNFKQVDLAEKTGIHKAMISSYLTGKYEPKQDNLYLIATVLNVNPGYLLGLDVSIDEETNSMITKITTKLKVLSKSQLRKIDSLIDTLFGNEYEIEVKDDSSLKDFDMDTPTSEQVDK